MTCIVGLKHDGKVYIGGDSLASNGQTKVVREDKKIFKPYPNIVSGFTTSYRMGQLLMYNEEIFEEVSSHRSMVNDFIPRLQVLFDSSGYRRNFDSGEKEGGVFLIGINSLLYKIDSDFHVAVTSNDFDTCGCGEEFALGSLHSTEGLSMNPLKRIELALEAAERFSTGVQRPFYIMNTENDEVIEIK